MHLGMEWVKLIKPIVGSHHRCFFLTSWINQMRLNLKNGPIIDTIKTPFKLFPYLSIWLVQTMTGCWEVSLFSLTWSTTCTQTQLWDWVSSRKRSMHDLSCSDCVISRCFDWASLRFSQWTRSYHESPWIADLV